MSTHRQPPYARLAAPGSLPVTEHLTDSTLILPLFHQMDETQQARVVDVLASRARRDRAALVLVAASGLAREAAAVVGARRRAWVLAGVLDDAPTCGHEVGGVPVLGTDRRRRRAPGRDVPGVRGPGPGPAAPSSRDSRALGVGGDRYATFVHPRASCRGPAGSAAGACCSPVPS